VGQLKQEKKPGDTTHGNLIKVEAQQARPFSTCAKPIKTIKVIKGCWAQRLQLCLRLGAASTGLDSTPQHLT